MTKLLLLVGALLSWLALGPWGLLAVPVALAVPSVRRRLRPTWRSAAALAGTAVLLAAGVVLLPDGSLPIPPGGGLLVTPAYVGAPATPQPIGVEIPQHPRMAVNGVSSMHNDAWASDAYPWAGPLGRDPQVDTAWYGVEECATLAFDSRGRLVAMCGDLRGPTLHVLDPDTLRKDASLRLPDRPAAEGTRPWENLCGGAYFYLDEQDRAVVATTDQRIVVVSTRDGDGQPVLTANESHDLSGELPAGECLLALMPDWSGRIWFASLGGWVGFVEPRSGRVAVLDLGDDIMNSFAADEQGVYVVTNGGLFQVAAERGRPAVRWRAAYDAGDRKKPGQLTQGSGTTPTVLPEGLVAITDNADPRMHVVFYRTEDGSEVCRAPVFDDGASATDNSLVAVDGGVIVENNYGYAGPSSTVLGRTTAPGVARVDVEASTGSCSVTWTSEVIAPTSVPKVSLANGLLYVYSLRPSRWAVSAWYLTAIDVRTGETAFSVRTGLGIAHNNHYAAVTLAPDGSAYIATLTGLIRVRDSA